MFYKRSVARAAEYALDDLISEHKDQADTINEQKERIAELEKKLDENEYELTLANRQIARLEDEIRVVSE